MQNDHVSFDGISLKPISFSKSSVSGRHYRGSVAKGCSSLSLAADSIMDDKPLFMSPLTHLTAKTRSMSAIDIALSADYPASKVPGLPELCPLDMQLSMTDDDEDMCASKPLSGAGAVEFVPPSLAAHSASRFCNAINSLVVQSASCEEVASQLSRMLWSTYSDNIDLKIDFSRSRQQLDGVVFISNLCVDFLVNLWPEAPDSTRVEFRRKSGDAMAAAKLWATIQSSLCSQKEPQSSFISLELNMDDFPSLVDSTSSAVSVDLDELLACLMDNDLFVVHELQTLCDALVDNDLLAAKVLSHRTLMRALIDSSLLNKDVSVTRCVLLILERVAGVTSEAGELERDAQLFDNISMLLKHQRCFIRKSCVRLVSSLLSSQRQCVWYADRASKQRMIDNVRTCAAQVGGEHADDAFRAMCATIDETLKMM